MSKKIVIIAAETSGDIQAAQLAKSIKRLSPEIILLGVGGKNLADADVKLIFDSTRWGVIGIVEAIKKVPYLWFVVEKLKKKLIEIKPDLLILIDSPAINMRLAHFAKKNHIKTLYYFPPSAWTRNHKKANLITELIDEIVAVFSFTAQTYGQSSHKINFFGHPMVDLMKESYNQQKILEKLDLPADKIIVGILPGSRTQEIRYLLPVMLKAAGFLLGKRSDIFYVLPVANRTLKNLIKSYIKGTSLPLKLIESSATDLMKVAHLVITASGTATLEAAFYQTPMIILYKLHWLDWIASKILIKGIPFAGLPNLISQKKAVPEFLQSEVRAEDIARTAELLLTDAAEIQKIKTALKKVKESLGSPPVVDKVAQLALGMVKA